MKAQDEMNALDANWLNDQRDTKALLMEVEVRSRQKTYDPYHDAIANGVSDRDVIDVIHEVEATTAAIASNGNGQTAVQYQTMPQGQTMGR